MDNSLFSVSYNAKYKDLIRSRFKTYIFSMTFALLVFISAIIFISLSLFKTSFREEKMIKIVSLTMIILVFILAATLSTIRYNKIVPSLINISVFKRDDKYILDFKSIMYNFNLNILNIDETKNYFMFFLDQNIKIHVPKRAMSSKALEDVKKLQEII